MFEVQEFVDVLLQKEEKRFHGAILFGNEDHVIVGCRSSSSENLSPGQLVQLIQAVDGEVYEFNSQIISCRPNAFVLKRVTPIVVERRRYTRYDCKLLTLYSCDSANDDATRTEERRRCNAVDISEGGVKLIIKEELPNNTSLDLEIELGDLRTLLVRAILLRSRPTGSRNQKDPSSSRFVASVQFLNLSGLDRRILLQFLNQVRAI